MNKPYMPCVALPKKKNEYGSTMSHNGSKKSTKLPASHRRINKSNSLLRSFYSHLKDYKGSNNNKSKERKSPECFNPDDKDDTRDLSERTKAKIKALEQLKEEYEKEKEKGSDFILSSDSSGASDTHDSDTDSSESKANSTDGDNDVQIKTSSSSQQVVKSVSPDKCKPSTGKTDEKPGITDLERLAMEEILRETRREAEIAGQSGIWAKPVVPPTNKRFLRNLLTSTLRKPLHHQRRSEGRPDWYMKSQGEYGDKLWRGRFERLAKERQRNEDEWRDYNNSHYYKKSPRQYRGYEAVDDSDKATAAAEEPNQREKFEAYIIEQKKLKKQYEEEFEDLKERHKDRGHLYHYDAPGRRDAQAAAAAAVAATETIILSSDEDDYLEFKDAHHKNSIDGRQNGQNHHKNGEKRNRFPDGYAVTAPHDQQHTKDSDRRKDKQAMEHCRHNRGEPQSDPDEPICSRRHKHSREHGSITRHDVHSYHNGSCPDERGDSVGHKVHCVKNHSKRKHKSKERKKHRKHRNKEVATGDSKPSRYVSNSGIFSESD